MTIVTPSTSSTRPRTGVLRFARHFGEMIVAMIVGMAALGALWRVALSPWIADFSAFTDEHVSLVALVMAFDMTLPMVAWMRFRGHDWVRGAEMAGAMFVPTVALICLLEIGALAGDSLIGLQHAVMLPAMLGVMLWRRQAYSHAHRAWSLAGRSATSRASAGAAR